MAVLHPGFRLIGALRALILLATAAPGAGAQEATPPTATVTMHVYPVSIHRGTCEAPVAQPVGSSAETSIAGFDTDSELVGVSGQSPVLTASVEFDGTLEELTDSPHVLAIHASPEGFGTIVACGEIAGYEDDGTLIVPIRSGSRSDVSGIAFVHEGRSFIDMALEELGASTDLTDDTVTVAVYIASESDEDSGA